MGWKAEAGKVDKTVLWRQAQGCRQLTQLCLGHYFHLKSGAPGCSPAQRRIGMHQDQGSTELAEGLTSHTDTYLPCEACLNPVSPPDSCQLEFQAGLQLPMDATGQVWGGQGQPASDRPHPGPIFLRAASCKRGDGDLPCYFQASLGVASCKQIPNRSVFPQLGGVTQPAPVLQFLMRHKL